MTNWVLPLTRVLCQLLLVCVVAWQVHAQQSQATNAIADRDKTSIIRSVLVQELKVQKNGFRNVRELSPENIPPSLIPELSLIGFNIVRPTKPISGGSVTYMAFRGIKVEGEEVHVTVAEVAEGDPCFGAPYSKTKYRRYRCRKVNDECEGELTYGSLGGVAPGEMIFKY